MNFEFIIEFLTPKKVFKTNNSSDIVKSNVDDEKF